MTNGQLRAVRLLAVAMTTLSVSASSSSASAQDVPATVESVNPPAIDNLSDCMQLSGTLLAEFVIDESESLAHGNTPSDPDDARVPALQAGLRGLQRLASTAVRGENPDVEVRLSGFASEYTDYSDWIRLDDDGLEDALDEAAEFANRDDTHGTNYRAALEGARESLADRAAEIADDGDQDAQPCRAVVFFTDGRYQIDGGTEEARRRLCEAGGPPDALRDDGVVLLTVGLAAEGFSTTDQAYLGALTLGDYQGGHCGSNGSEEQGIFLTTPDPEELQFLLCCPGRRPESGSGPFSVVPGISSVILDVSTGNQAVGFELVPPQGEPVPFGQEGPSEVQVGEVQARQRWYSPTAGEIELLIPPGDEGSWLGEWQAQFLGRDDDADWLATYDSAYEPVLESPDEFVIGERSRLVVVVESEGTELTQGALIDGAQLRAEITDPITDETVVTDLRRTGRGRYEGDHVVPDDTSASLLEVTLDLDFPVVDGVDLQSERSNEEVPTRLPSTFPYLSPEEQHLDTLTGSETIEARFTVHAGIADGCVWLEPESSRLSGPDEARGFTMTAEARGPDAPSAPMVSHGSCLRVNARDEEHFVVLISPDHDGLGLAEGVFHFGVTGDREHGRREISVPVEFSMRPTPCTWCRILITGGLFALGVFIPLGLVYLLNRSTAKFDSPAGLRVACAIVGVRDDGSLVRLADDPRRSGNNLDMDGQARERDLDEIFDPLQDDFQSLRLPENETARKIKVDGSLELRARALGSIADRSIHLFRGAFGEAEANHAVLVAGAPVGAERSWRGHEIQEVPLALRGAWVFVVTRGLESPTAPTFATSGAGRDLDYDGPAAVHDADLPVRYEGRLYAFASGGHGADQYQGITSRIRPQLLDKLNDVAAATAGQRTETPGRVRVLAARLRALRPHRRPAARRPPSASAPTDTTTSNDPPPEAPPGSHDLDL